MKFGHVGGGTDSAPGRELVEFFSMANALSLLVLGGSGGRGTTSSKIKMIDYHGAQPCSLCWNGDDD